MEGTERVVGLCQTMCPVEEFEMREREGLLHQLELPSRRCPPQSEKIGRSRGRGRGRGREKHRPEGDLDLAVKEYSRPAAGRADPDPRVLRPPRVLHNTIRFLLNTHIGRQHSHENWKEVYEFVFDRLRAVRQDMVIQELSGHDAVTILEACVSFHLYAAYRLCETGLETFDPVINHHHTQECLKRLLYLYSQTDTDSNMQTHSHTTIPRTAEGADRHRCRHSHEDVDSRCERMTDHKNEDTQARQQTDRHSSGEITPDDRTGQTDTECAGSDQELEARMRGLSMSNSISEPTSTSTFTCTFHTQASEDRTWVYPNRAEFESVYLLYNLGDSHALSHFLQLSPNIRCERQPALAYKMSVSCMLGNTLRVMRLAASLSSPLTLCAFHRHLASIQSRGLQVLCAGFSSKATRFPLTKLGQLLAHDSESQTEAACRESGLHVQEGTVLLLKSSYQPPERVRSGVWEYLEGRLTALDLPHLLLGH